MSRCVAPVNPQHFLELLDCFSLLPVVPQQDPQVISFVHAVGIGVKVGIIKAAGGFVCPEFTFVPQPYDLFFPFARALGEAQGLLKVLLTFREVVEYEATVVDAQRGQFRIFCIAAGGFTAHIILIRPPHRGHARTSNSNTRIIS